MLMMGLERRCMLRRPKALREVEDEEDEEDEEVEEEEEEEDMSGEWTSEDGRDKKRRKEG
jgi:hypothetical protein